MTNPKCLIQPLLPLVLILFALATAACSDSQPSLSSPTGPSDLPAPQAPSGSSGARISGQVNGGSGLALNASALATQSLTVTVVGTNVSATVGSSGSFVLTGVPAGTVQLQFTGSGVNATIVLSGVGQQEQIHIAVTVAGNNATLEANHRVTPDNRVEVEGRIIEITPATRTLRVAGSEVSVSPSATIRHGSQAFQFSDLKVGDRIHVRGTMQGGVVQALEIILQNQNLHPSIEIEGIVSGLTGSCPALTFTVRGTVLITNGSTYFKGGLCQAIQNGSKVEVKGTRQDGKVLATKVEIEDGDHHTRVELEGTVSGLSGNCLTSLTFIVQGTTVITNSATTRFEGGPCGAVQNGTKVEVKGTRQDGKVLATKVEIED